MSQWIPVDERLPDDETTVLVYLPTASEPVWFGFHAEVEWWTAEYFRCKPIGWWHDCEDTAIRFLTLCHHCATADVANPMAVLVKMCKADLDTSRCKHESENWAARIWKRSSRNPSNHEFAGQGECANESS